MTLVHPQNDHRQEPLVYPDRTDHVWDRIFAPTGPQPSDADYASHPIVSGDRLLVSRGGNPFWTTVEDPAVRDLARVLDAEAFDADAEAVAADCMVGGWGDQNHLRAVMDHGTRRFVALVNAQVSVWFLSGRPAPHFCAWPSCAQRIDHTDAAARAATAQGWFIQRDGDWWCPEHTPGWVTDWRSTKGLPAPRQHARDGFAPNGEDYIDFDDYDGLDENPRPF